MFWGQAHARRAYREGEGESATAGKTLGVGDGGDGDGENGQASAVGDSEIFVSEEHSQRKGSSVGAWCGGVGGLQDGSGLGVMRLRSGALGPGEDRREGMHKGNGGEGVVWGGDGVRGQGAGCRRYPPPGEFDVAPERREEGGVRVGVEADDQQYAGVCEVCDVCDV